MKTEKLVSVLVCSYKEERYIEDCLNSILKQTYNNIELIVANDCSDDKTYYIAKEWAARHSDRFTRCVVYRNEKNLGISKNFNGLIKRAKGDFIKPICADDMILPRGLEREVEYLQSYEEHEIVYANCLIIDETEGYPLSRNSEMQLFYNDKPKSGLNLTADLIKNDFIAAPSVMYRSTTFQNYGLYREDLAFEDWEYWLRLSCQGASIGYLDEPVVAYRMRIGSNSHVGKGRKEERFYNNTNTEEKILMEYKEYASEAVFDAFWNRVVCTCINNNYKDTLRNVLTKNFRKTKATRIKLFLYATHTFTLVQWARQKVNKIRTS